jgi:ADP-heptose:LPS heptosyltransferase
VLVLRPGALGDTLLALPALRALRSRVGDVTLAAHAGAARLLAELGEVNRGLAFDDPSLAWVFTTPPAREPVVAWMSEPVPCAVVQAPSRPGDATHCATYLLQTLAPLNVNQKLDVTPLRIAPVACDEVLLHPGSGSAAKNWPAHRFADVARALEPRVRMIVGEADAAAAAAVEHALGHALPRLEHAPLRDLAQRLAGCRAYVGNDSGVSHLAGLCGAVTLAMFGPTDARVWRPIGPRVEVLPFEATADEVLSVVAAL